MFVLIRTFKNVHSMEEAARRAQSGIGEIVKRIPSFGGYFVFDAGQGVGGSITFLKRKRRLLRPAICHLRGSAPASPIRFKEIPILLSGRS